MEKSKVSIFITPSHSPTSLLMLRRAVGGLVERFSKAARAGKNVQAQADFALGAAMLEMHDRIHAGGATPEEVVRCVGGEEGGWWGRGRERMVGGRVRRDFVALQKKWQEKELAECLMYANEQMVAQLADLFQHLYDLDHGDVVVPAAAPSVSQSTTSQHSPTPSPSTHTSPRPSEGFLARASEADDRARAERAVRDILTKRAGFSLWLGPSQAPTPSHTAGLYLKGVAQPGTVVAIFPGAVYDSSMRMRAEDAGHLGDPRTPDRVLLPRYDGAVVDVTGWESSATSNPYALAHFARHPPLGITPNCVRLQVDFPSDEDAKVDPWNATQPFPPHLRPYIPNRWGARVSGGQTLHGAMETNIFAKSLVLITTRQVFQEELFVDHRLDPAQPTPSWYVPLNPEADRRTWAAVRSSDRPAIPHDDSSRKRIA
jgi:hypothetical protein